MGKAIVCPFVAIAELVKREIFELNALKKTFV